MADQIIEDGTILTTPSGIELQLTGFRYSEGADGERINEEYIFRPKAVLDAEREAEEQHQRELEAEAEAEAGTAPELPTENNEGVQ